jgi:quercetin dioxygenase-like cupin family protein
MKRETGVVGSARRELNVGELIREIRVGLDMSVRTLAGKAGFSPSFISQVELGQVSPSVASLERIAMVLGITLGELFQATSPKAAVVMRADDRQRLVSSWSRAEVEPLGPVGAGHKLEPVMITIAPGGRSGKHAQGHAGEQFAIIFEGEATLTLGEETYVLRRGDAVTFRSETFHQWENSGSEPVRIVVVTGKLT